MLKGIEYLHSAFTCKALSHLSSLKTAWLSRKYWLCSAKATNRLKETKKDQTNKKKRWTDKYAMTKDQIRLRQDFFHYVLVMIH